MRVTLMRHFRVGYAWRRFCTAREFEDCVRGYDEADVVPGEASLAHGYARAYASPLKRARRTLLAVRPDLPSETSDLLKEVPMAPFLGARIRLPVLVWRAMARLQWLLNARRQPETRRQTRARAEAFADGIRRRGEDCLVVSHGFFLWTLSRVLLRAGFRGPRFLRLGNGERLDYDLRTPGEAAGG